MNQKESTTDIKVLGSGCANCHTLEARTKDALARLGVAATMSEVTDMGEIMNYGVMSTPALVIDGEVVFAGRVPSVAQLQDLLAAAK